jgi:hypothetical protein
MKSFANHGQSRFAGDPRYYLQSVTDGFRNRIDDRSDDTELLNRICSAYIKATMQQQSAPEAFMATGWWQQVRRASLGPVMHALLTRDIDALRGMYRNFFRDPCAQGLIGLPFGMSKAYFGGTIGDVYRRYYLSDALYRIDYWMAQTEGRFTLANLAGPEVGNPFGVILDGTLIETGAEYRHYCAHKISGLLPSGTASVAEIGGGFGGMAYYLLRDRPGITYLDFDVPESLALASYYLMKAFPHLNFLLYGERELTMDAGSRPDVILMPLFELTSMPTASVDIAFSSHAMSDISSEAITEYLKNIARITQRAFLYLGNSNGGETISSLMERGHESFQLAEMRPSGWNSLKVPNIGEVEVLYCAPGS